MSDLGLIKKFRSFRINIQEDDSVDFRLFIERGHSREEVKGLSIKDLSLSGIGFVSREDISRGLDLIVHLSFKNLEFEIPGQLTRSRPIYNEYGECEKYACGIEFQMSEQKQSKRFIERFISSFSVKRLKQDLIELVTSEGVTFEQSYRDKISLLVTLHNDMRDFDSIESLLKILFDEVKRQIGAEICRFYLVGQKQKDLRPFNFGTDEFSNEKYSYKGSVIEKCVNLKQIKNIKVASAFEKDSFFRPMSALFGEKIRNSVVAPVKDDQGTVVAIVEFSNKMNGDFFNDQDELVIEAFSQIVSSVRKEFHREPANLNNEVSDMDSDPLMFVGISEGAEKVRDFIEKTGKTDDHLIIWGEYGVGKKMVAQAIHKKGKRSSLPVGVINCRQIETVDDLKYIFEGNSEHVGKLELYTGGSLVLKDVCTLTTVLQNQVFQMFSKRKDIRLLCTSLKSPMKAVEEGEFDKEFFEFVGKHEIRVPPLRERPEDVLPLVQHFITKICLEEGLYIKKFSDELIQFFKDYNWPGNTQEVITAVERLVTYNFNQHIIENVVTKVTPIIEVDYGQVEIFRNIFGFFSDVRLEGIDYAEFEALYFYALVQVEQEKGESLNDLASLFGMTPARIQEKMFYCEEVAQRFFGLAVKKSA